MRKEPTEWRQYQSHERRLELGDRELQQAQLQERGNEDTAPVLACPGWTLPHTFPGSARSHTS